MTSITPSITSSITTEWNPTYGAAFITTDSDGVGDTEYLVFTPVAHARQSLEELWSTVREAEDAAVSLWRSRHPQPEIYYFAPTWTKSTWGEQRRHQERLKATNDAYWSQLKATTIAAHEASYADLPLVRANITDARLNLWPPEASGHAHQDAPIAGPLAIIHGRGHTPYTDFAQSSDLTPGAYLITIDGRTFVAYDNPSGPPSLVTDPGTLTQAFTDAAAAADAVFANRQRNRQLTLWAAGLSPEQADSLDFTNYRLFERFRPKDNGHDPGCSHCVTRPLPAPDKPHYGTTPWDIRSHAVVP
jgi:hypothetical protein